MTAKKEECKNELEQAKADLAQMSENFLRLQAEFANFKKRSEDQQKHIFKLATGEVLKEYIKVIDDFQLALHNKEVSHDDFKHGMELIFAKLVSSGEELGLERIKTVGEQFNPREHEALLTMESDKPENEIVEELQSGYKVGDTVIRTAKVKVSKNSSHVP